MKKLFSNSEYKILEFDWEMFEQHSVLHIANTIGVDISNYFIISNCLLDVPDLLFSDNGGNVGNFLKNIDDCRFICICLPPSIIESEEWKYFKRMCLDNHPEYVIRYLNMSTKKREPPFMVQIRDEKKDIIMEMEDDSATIDYIEFFFVHRHEKILEWKPTNKNRLKQYCRNLITKRECLISFKFYENLFSITLDECYACLSKSSLERFDYIVNHYPLNPFEVLKRILPIDFYGDKYAICCNVYGKKIYRWEQFSKCISVKKILYYTEHFWKLAKVSNQSPYDIVGIGGSKVLARQINAAFILSSSVYSEYMEDDIFCRVIKFLPHTKNLFQYNTGFYKWILPIFIILRRKLCKNMCWMMGKYIWEEYKKISLYKNK